MSSFVDEDAMQGTAGSRSSVCCLLGSKVSFCFCRQLRIENLAVFYLQERTGQVDDLLEKWR
jgi:hypothetical protein